MIFLPIESAVSARETGDGTSVLSSDLSLADEVRSFTAFPPAGGSPKKAWYARGVRGGSIAWLITVWHRAFILSFRTIYCLPLRLVLNWEATGVCA